MSLTTPYQRIFYTSDGATSIYSFPFDGISKDYIRVNVKHTNGTIDNDVNVEIPLQVTGQMVGTIVFPAGQIPESGAVIMIERVTPLSQNVNYANQIQFSAAAIDSSFDKLQAQIQEIADRLNTSSVGTSAFQEDSFNFALMTAANQNQYLQIDYANKTIKGGLFMELASGNRYRVSANGSTWYYLPRSNDIQEIRMVQLQNPTRNVLQYRVGNTWYATDFTDIYYTKPEIDAKESALSGRINTNETTIGNHLANYSNPHQVTKTQVGLSNVDNTSDLSKPISNATQNALNAKQNTLIPGAGITIDGDTISATGLDVPVDTELSDTSVNPVQNKVIAQALNTKQDEATAVNYDNITNCITEIPQDIKLELADGTLTLKAGSKVYLATGDSSFPAQTVDTDIERTSIYNGRYVVIRNGQTSLYFANLESCTSGTIADRPTSTPNASGLYFATDENKMYLTGNSGANWYSTQYMTLPIAIVTVSNSAISSIDQVFNGFGYIGSTVFALPGVKGLIPNGRNEDGTLKNIEFTISKVVTATDSSTSTNALTINNPNITRVSTKNYFYDEQKNIIINKHNNAQLLAALYGFNKTNNGVVSEFVTKTSFRAVDYSDTEFIAHQAMPSDRYIDLTPQASQTVLTLTAPADGYYTLTITSTATGQGAGIDNLSNSLSADCYSSGANQDLSVSMPVSTGQIVALNVHPLSVAITQLRFVYANGAK